MIPEIKSAYERGMLQVTEEIEWMCEFVKWQKPKVVVEIGACYGSTAVLWRQFAKPKLLISIDKGTSICGRADVDFEKRSQLFEEHDILEIRGDSQSQNTYDALIKALNGAKIDMLVIDGDHTFEGVFHDYLIYKDLVSENGFIAFHDILKSAYHDNLDCKAAYVWEQLKGKLKISVVGNGNGGGGWGILLP